MRQTLVECLGVMILADSGPVHQTLVWLVPCASVHLIFAKSKNWHLLCV